MLEGLVGLLIFVFDVVAILKVVGSSAPTGTKVVWVLVILLLPVVGLLLWWFMGPR